MSEWTERSEAFSEAQQVVSYARSQGETDCRQISNWLDTVERHGINKFLEDRGEN